MTIIARRFKPVQYCAFLFLMAVKRVTLAAIVVFLFPKSFERRSTPPKHIFVYRTGGLGDFLFGVPALWQLRRTYPQARITLVTALALTARHRARITSYVGNSSGAPWLDFVRGTHVDNIIFLASVAPSYLWTVIRPLVMQDKPDLTFILSYPGESFIPLAKKIMLLWLVGAGCSALYGWRRNISYSIYRRYHAKWGLVRNKVTGPLEAISEFKFLSPLQESELEFNLNVPDAARRWAEGFTRSLSPSGLVILIAPGAIQPHKPWPEENYTLVVKRILDIYPHVHVVVVGTKVDRSIGLRMQNAIISDRFHTLADELPIENTAALMSVATCLITNDGGAAHLATAIHCPVITIGNGIEEPGTVDPWFSRDLVVRHIVSCSPCYSEEFCPEGHSNCVRRVPTAAVIELIRTQIESTQLPTQHCGLEQPTRE